MSADRAEQGTSLGGLIGSLATDIQDLVRGEVRLARVELDQKLDRVIAAAIWILGGALMAFAGLVVVLEGGAAALAMVMPVWAASLIIGIIIVVIGALLARSGMSRLSLKTLRPDRTAANLQKDAHMLKEHTR
jgi:uncharacterized membrane protein YqjE